MTAVEWLKRNINLFDLSTDKKLEILTIINQALEMEKQQTRDIIKIARDVLSVRDYYPGVNIEYKHSEDSIIEQLKNKP